MLKILKGRLPGYSPSRIQGYPQDDGIGKRIVKKGKRKRLDLPWFTQKANKVPDTELVLFTESAGALSDGVRTQGALSLVKTQGAFPIGS